MKTAKLVVAFIALMTGLTSCIHKDGTDSFGNTPESIENFYERFSKEIKQAKDLPKPTDEDPFEEWKLRVVYAADYRPLFGCTNSSDHANLFYGKKFDFHLKYGAATKYNSIYSCTKWDSSSNEDWVQNYNRSLDHVDKIVKLEFEKVYPKSYAPRNSNSNNGAKYAYDTYANPNSRNPNSLGYNQRMKMFGLRK